MAPTVEVEGLLELADGASCLWLRRYDQVAPRQPNLTCYGKAGEKLWDAEELQSLDKWVSVRAEDGRIFANSWGGFLCELNPKSGKIVTSTFVK